MALKKLQPQVIHTVDENGEVLRTDFIENEVFVKDSKEFCFLFGKLQAALLGLESNEIKVLIWCSLNSSFNTNEVVLNKAIKERMMATTNLKKSSVSNALCKLTKKGMLIHPATGIYIVNPDTTWKGKLSLRDKQVEVFTRFTIENPIAN